MRKDAEAHAEEDKKKFEEAETLNEADAFVFSVEKAESEMKGKVDKKKLDEVVKLKDEIKSLLEKKELSALKPRLEEANKKMQELSAELYQKAAAEQQAKQSKGSSKDDDTVVDAKAKKADKAD